MVMNPGIEERVGAVEKEERGKVEVVIAEEDSDSGVEEKSGMAEAEEAAARTVVCELLDGTVLCGRPVLL